MTAKSRKKTNRKSNSVWIFVSIIIVIAIISMLFSYFWLDQEKPEVLLLPATGQEQEQEISEPTQKQLEFATPIEGIWVSNYDGVMLTIKGLTFTLESSGVDEVQKIKGDLSIEENIVTFVYTSGTEVCKGPEGHYLYSLENDEVFFKLIKDICDGRKERMTANWFRL